LSARICFTDLLRGSVASVAPDLLRPEEHDSDDEEFYQPDLEAEIRHSKLRA
jgi:hypothetical protein